MNRKLTSVLAAILMVSQLISAATFTSGNIVIFRVGDGSTALINTGNPVFLDEYTPAGVLVQSIAMPTVAVGSNKALVASGAATSEGLITTSTDGQYVFLTGYDGVAATSLSGTTGAAKNRVIGRVDAAGNINTTTALTDFADGNTPRSVVSTNGTDIWMAGAAGGVRYTTLGSTTSTQLSTTLTNIRQVNIFDGQVYVSTSSGSAIRIGKVGTGTPMVSGQTIITLPGLPSSTGSPYNFFFADLSNTVAGVDVLYIADDGGNILKYSLVAGSWTANGSATAAGVRGLIGSVNATKVTLYATTGASLYSFVDNTGYNATMSGAASVIASAATNMAFRGIGFAPVPSVPTCTPVTIAVQPASSGIICNGLCKTSFVVQVSGTGPFTYQWQENSVNISDGGVYLGTSNDTLSITNATFALNNKTYRCIVTNCSGSKSDITDNKATLNINPVVVKKYTWNTLATLGTYNGVAIKEGGSSGLSYIRGTTNEYYTITDRGANLDANANPHVVSDPNAAAAKLFVLPSIASVSEYDLIQHLDHKKYHLLGYQHHDTLLHGYYQSHRIHQMDNQKSQTNLIHLL